MRSVVALLLVVLCFVTDFSAANPLLNINTEEKVIYDNILSSKNSEKFILSLKPLSNYYAALSSYPYRVKPLLNSFDKSGWYIKPFNTLTFKAFYTDADYLLLEGQSGTYLLKGFNFYGFEDGFISLGKRSTFYYQLRQIYNKDIFRNEIFRLYWKFKFYKFSVEIGKDNVNWGPGEYGLLLSNNVPPYKLIKFETEKPLKLIGDWKFSLVRGWLDENRIDISDPNILGLRIVWKPADFIEIGGTKTTMYGGKGRPSYKLKDYWDVVVSSKDNVSGDKFDNDSYAAYDISIYIPLKQFDIFKLYYQEAGSDVNAIWQEEDSGKLKDRFPFIFSLLKPAYQTGLLIAKGSNIFRFEYASTADVFYVHHWYRYEGYTYKGFSLGYPYGRDMRSFLIKYLRYFDKNWLEFKAGYILQPEEFSDEEKRTYFSLEYSKFVNNLLEIRPFFRLDYIKNYDTNTLPTQFNLTDKTKTFITLGISTFIRF
ncbi:capsule assembly Wzi family protein [Persephonella sp.]